MLKLRTLGLFFALLIAGLASAATIGHGVLRGEIVAGDSQRLIDFLTSEEGRVWTQIGVSSPSGSVDEAIRMAKIIKFMHLLVSVEKNGHCASACFFLFLAGSPRFAASAEYMDGANIDRNRTQSRPPAFGFVGLHRPYLHKIENFENQQAKVMRDVST